MKCEMRLVEMINGREQRGVAPEPNEVASDYVMKCLVMDSEGDGMLFAALFENKLLYASANTSWYVWRGHYWQRDKVDQVLGLVRHVTDRYGQEIKSLEEKIALSKQENDPEDHKAYASGWNKKIGLLQKKIKDLRQDKGRNACIRFAHTHFGNPFAIEGNEFDKDPWLLGVQNGVVDLKTGILYPGDPGQLISKRCSCNFIELDKIIDMDPWLRFLSDIYDGDQDLIEFLQILFGYGITGLTHDHVFPFFLGSGRNGKSLLMSTVMRILGDYAAVIPSELFLKSNQQKASNQTDPAVMKLEGLRVAVADEVEEGSKLSAKEVKRITGGGTLEGRNPYDRELRNFQPTHLAIMVGNHEPTPPAGDPAFWDRTFLIRHPVRFVKSEPDPGKKERKADPDIDEKLNGMDEMALAWMVEGCLKFQAAGKKIVPPASVLKATDDYRDDADWLGQFVEACCIRTNKDTGATILYEAFAVWFRKNLNRNKNFTPTQRAFGLKLKERGEFEQIRRGDGVYYKGIALNLEWQQRMLEAESGQDSTPSEPPFGM